MPFSVVLITFYLRRCPKNILMKFYAALRFVLPLLPLILIIVLPVLGFSIGGYIIFCLVAVAFLEIVAFFLFKERALMALIIQFALLEILFLSIITPYYEKSAEKEAGVFVADLIKANSNAKICSINKPVANVYFYSQINKKVEEFSDFNSCQIVIVRQELDISLRKEAEENGFTIKEFIRNKDRSKNYYVLYNSYRLQNHSEPWCQDKK